MILVPCQARIHAQLHGRQTGVITEEELSHEPLLDHHGHVIPAWDLRTVPLEDECGRFREHMAVWCRHCMCLVLFPVAKVPR